MNPSAPSGGPRAAHSVKAKHAKQQKRDSERVDWLPLSQRGKNGPPPSLVGGIPEYLVASLDLWLSDVLAPRSSETLDLLLDPQFEKRRISRLGRRLHLPLSAMKQVRDLLVDDEQAALDLVDAVVADLEEPQDVDAIVNLDRILTEAGSAYAVSCGAPHWQLINRVDPTVSARQSRVTSARDSAATHLANAWSAQYSRHPDHNQAVLEAVKALEAAAQPAITPKDAKATLGKMIKALQDKPDKWSTPVGSVDQLAAALDMVWATRVAHGEPQRVVAVDARTAEAVVHLAITYCLSRPGIGDCSFP